MRWIKQNAQLFIHNWNEMLQGAILPFLQNRQNFILNRADPNGSNRLLAINISPPGLQIWVIASCWWGAFHPLVICGLFGVFGWSCHTICVCIVSYMSRLSQSGVGYVCYGCVLWLCNLMSYYVWFYIISMLSMYFGVSSAKPRLHHHQYVASRTCV